MSRALAVLLLVAACAPAGPGLAPARLRAGVATAPLDVPVGVSTGGYGRWRKASDPASPWADEHVATIGVQTQPTARALALSNGRTTAVWVRIDACVAVATLRWRAQALLEAAGHAAPLILQATHTHSGPGRYFHPAPAAGTGGIDPARIGMDSFDPEVEARMAEAIATAAGAALDALTPVAVGVASVDASELNRDRRCANDDLYGPGFRDGQLTVVRFDEVGAGGAPLRPLTGMIHFALHGTVLDDDNHLLSVDAPGAIELAGSDTVGVPLVFVQGAAGDVSPDTGGHGDFQGMEVLGRRAARKVADAWARARPRVAPEGEVLRHYELALEPTRAAIGYARGEFPEFGAAACGLGERRCPPVEVDPKTVVCIPLARRPFRETSVTALQVGPVLLGTLPGEPTTAEGEKVKAAGVKVPGVTHVLTAGYAQDHFGYLLEAPDFLRLGYEPYVSPLGWKFGDFIVGRLGESFLRVGTEAPVPTRPDAVPFEPRPMVSSAGPARQLGATADLQRLEAAELVFEGGDPGLGTPRVSLEREVNGQFEPVRASAVRWVVGGPDIVLFLEGAPGSPRWRAVWETLADTPLGRYRLVAQGQLLSALGQRSGYRVEGNPFQVVRSDALGATGQGKITPSGALALTLRLPPNPSVRDATGTVVRHFRLRDEQTRGNEGARAQGGSATAVLRSPDGVERSLRLDWDEAASAYVTRGVSLAPGAHHLTVPAGGLVDGFDNTNRGPVTLTLNKP